MSGSKDVKAEVMEMFRKSLGDPPPPEAAVGNLKTKPSKAMRERSDRTEQLNLRVPLSLKRRVRLLATRDDISLSEVIIRAVELYEEKFGPAPKV